NWSERRTLNPQVLGSSPRGGTGTDEAGPHGPGLVACAASVRSTTQPGGAATGPGADLRRELGLVQLAAPAGPRRERPGPPARHHTTREGSTPTCSAPPTDAAASCWAAPSPPACSRRRLWPTPAAPSLT